MTWFIGGFITAMILYTISEMGQEANAVKTGIVKLKNAYYRITPLEKKED